MEFFFKPWVGPVLAFLALIISVFGRAWGLSNNVANVLTILAISSALASYVNSKEK